MTTATKQQRLSATRSSTEMEVWMEVRDHKQLAKLMVIQGVTYKQLADGAGFKSTAYVHQLVTGKKKTLTPERAVAIAAFFKVGVDDLFLGRVSAGGGQPVSGPRKKVAA